MPHSSVAIVLSVEEGILEHQAILLVESLRRFGGPASDLPVYAISPRPARAPGADCLSSLRRLGATTIVEPLVDEAEAYGTLARLAACAWAEEHLAHPTIVSLDDDMLVVRPPDFSLGQADMVARPVDCKGMCTCGEGDEYDDYWRRASRACGVSYDDIPWVETTVDRLRVKASYNGGMVIVRRSLGLFREAARMFAILRGHDLAPRARGVIEVVASTGSVGPEASRWWGGAQAVLSLAATRLGAQVAVAPPGYNVPVHLAEAAARSGRPLSLTDAVLVHYHWMLDRGRLDPRGIIPGGRELPADFVAWLARRVPLGRPPAGNNDPAAIIHV
jgi:hypothetical protein